MSKFTFITLIFLFSFTGVRAWESFNAARYHGAIEITNPLSAMSKYGGALDFRIKQSAFSFGLIDYVGVYKGMQYKFEYRKYKRTDYLHEYYWYLKAVGGNALYASKQLEILGDKSNVEAGPIDYFGAGFGVGKRYNFKHLFITMSCGLKFVALPEDLSDEKRDLFRLFYATGPGSVIDLNFRFGYQF